MSLPQHISNVAWSMICEVALATLYFFPNLWEHTTRGRILSEKLFAPCFRELLHEQFLKFAFYLLLLPHANYTPFLLLLCI